MVNRNGHAVQTREEVNTLTLLEQFQMLPQDVADEGGRSRGEGILSHGTDVLPFHPELVQGDAVQGELFGGPLQPMGHVIFGPLSRIWKEKTRLLSSLSSFYLAVGFTHSLLVSNERRVFISNTIKVRDILRANLNRWRPFVVRVALISKICHYTSGDCTKVYFERMLYRYTLLIFNRNGNFRWPAPIWLFPVGMSFPLPFPFTLNLHTYSAHYTYRRKNPYCQSIYANEMFFFMDIASVVYITIVFVNFLLCFWIKIARHRLTGSKCEILKISSILESGLKKISIRFQRLFHSLCWFAQYYF